MLDNNLRILQANLNKSQIPTESTLQRAIELSIDIIVVQEPWLVGYSKSPLDYSGARSVAHSSFVQILPSLPHPSTRPRVLLYVSRFLQAQVNPIQDFFFPDPDFLIVSVKSQHFEFTLLNVYHEKDQQGSAVQTIERVLLPRNIPPSSLLLGDFNTHHHWWEPSTSFISSGAEEFVEWIEDQNLMLLNTPGEGTYFRPNMSRESTLDLSFCTSDLEPKVQDWQVLSTAGSDHHGIMFTLQVPSGNQVESSVQQTRFNSKKADWKRFDFKLAEAIQCSHSLSTLQLFPLPSDYDTRSLLAGENPTLAAQLDQLGQDLSDAIVFAASEAIPRIKLGPRPKPWWNDNLRTLRSTMVRANRSLQRELERLPQEDTHLWKRDYLKARNIYLQAVKRAKQEHWNSFLEKEDPASIFKAMSYTKNARVERIPLIQSPSSPALQDSFEGKCSAFKTTLFPPPPVTNPISWTAYTEGDWKWPTLSQIEVKMACSSKV